MWREQCLGLDKRVGRPLRGKVQTRWKWSTGLLGSARITGNQTETSRPPLFIQNLASNQNIQHYLAPYQTLNYIKLSLIHTKQKKEAKSTIWHIKETSGVPWLYLYFIQISDQHHLFKRQIWVYLISQRLRLVPHNTFVAGGSYISVHLQILWELFWRQL